MKTREDRLKQLKDNPDISVLIVGAGINGIGTFRDLALQGIDVALIDQGDYCSGASSASSHMVHGGIRYLENGEFQLVKEAVQERNRLLENAPHLVNPLQTTYPIFKRFSGLFNAPLKFLGLVDRPSERGAIIIKIGMILYDFFTRKQKTVPKHIFRNKKESIALFPDLSPEIIYTGTYYDGSMPSPERIAVELIKDTIEENDQAIPLNYVSLDSTTRTTVKLIDELSGESFSVNPKILVNATGPWIDLVNRTAGTTTQFISGTKGSHLILDHPELRSAIGDNEIYFENKDGRNVLIFPIKDKVMIGSSDIRVDNPNGIVITEEEIDYFFEMLKHVFPNIGADRSHIVYTFSGVRPLLYTKKGATGQISRNHKVQILEPDEDRSFPILSLVGGKWTSFRAFSEVATNKILYRLGLKRNANTENLKIGGGKDYPKTKLEENKLFSSWHKNFNCPIQKAEILFDRHGSQAKEIIESIDHSNDHPLLEYPDYSSGEIKYLIQQEDVIHLDDLIFRRTLLGKLGRITKSGLNELAEIAGDAFQWNGEEIEEEIQRVKLILRKKHLMEFNKYLFTNPAQKEEAMDK